MDAELVLEFSGSNARGVFVGPNSAGVRKTLSVGENLSTTEGGIAEIQHGRDNAV